MEAVRTRTANIDGGKKGRTMRIGPRGGGEEGHHGDDGWMGLPLRALPKKASHRKHFERSDSVPAVWMVRGPV